MAMTAFLWCHSAGVRSQCSKFWVILTFADLLVGSGSFAFHSTLKCMSLSLPEHSVANPTCRPNAVGGRTLDDLHGNYYVLRYILVRTIPTCPSGTRCCVGFVVNLHHSLPPLSTDYEKNTDIFTSSTIITSKTPTSTRMPSHFS